MDSGAPTISYPTAGASWRSALADPLRLIILVMTSIVLAYGARTDNSSPLTIGALERLVGSMGLNEVMMFGIIALEVVRRLIVGDFWINRSSASRSVMWVGIVIALYPFLRMLIEEQGFRFPWELAYLPLMVVAYFIWLMVYRAEDLYLMIWMIAVGGLFKAIEALSVYASVGLLWGLLTGWRDAMLLTIMVLAAIFAYVVKPEGDRAYARLRRFLLWCLPLTGVAFAACLRRGFILGLLVCVIVFALFMSKQERRSLRFIMVPVLGALVVGLFMVDINNFIYRVSGITDPGTEGSAAYRVLEFYNTWHMVLERPWFGWPTGTEMVNYTVLDFFVMSKTVPHNSYLYALVRAGVFGLGVWLWMLGSMCGMHIRTIRAARQPFERFLSLLLASSTMLIVITGFTIPVFTDHLQLMYPFFMVMASFLPGAWNAAKRFVPVFERA